MPASDSDEELRGDAALDGPLREREEAVILAIARRHGITSTVGHFDRRLISATLCHGITCTVGESDRQVIGNGLQRRTIVRMNPADNTLSGLSLRRLHLVSTCLVSFACRADRCTCWRSYRRWRR